MWDFSLSAALGAMTRTAPFIILRMIVYFGIAVLYILATGVGGALGYGFTSFGDGEGAGAFYGALFGFAGASGFLYWAREYILYLVKAGHIAVLVHVLDNRDFPGGKGQIEYAGNVVKDRFAQASVLFALDQIIKASSRRLVEFLNTMAMILPIPGLDSLMRIINSIMKMSLTYVDEVILAHIIRTGSDNPWETSRQAIILYAQNYKTMVKNAAWLWVDHVGAHRGDLLHHAGSGLRADGHLPWRSWFLGLRHGLHLRLVVQGGPARAARHLRPHAGLFPHHRRPNPQPRVGTTPGAGVKQVPGTDGQGTETVSGAFN